MNTELLPYIGIVISALLIIYTQVKESVQYWKLQIKNKINKENVKFDFNKSNLETSLSLNIFLICIIWAIYNNYNL